MYCPRSLKCLERMEDSLSKNNMNPKKGSSFFFFFEFTKKLLNIEIDRYRREHFNFNRMNGRSLFVYFIYFNKGNY